MLRHKAFYENLAGLTLDSPAWTASLSGLAVLNLVDAAREDRSLIDRDWTSIRCVIDIVSEIREGNPVRRPLMNVMDQIQGGVAWAQVDRGLLAYGRALDLDGHWLLAADVFEAVAEFARADREPDLAIEATTALGGAARRSGDWERSAAGYAEAAHLADRLGDRASGLTVRVGTANTLKVRGNLPAAQTIFEEVIEEAERSGLDGVAALAYHGYASVAHGQKRYGDAVRLAHMALEKTANPGVKDTIMADLAAFFVELGMHDAARDAHMVISLTSRYQWVRWQAAINLMELATMDGMEAAFEDYGRELRNAALDPRLRSYFLLYYGQGCIAFGRTEQGVAVLHQARDFAASHKINQVAFEAEQSLAEAREKNRRQAAPQVRGEPVPEEVSKVAEALVHLREAAVSSPPGEDWS